MDRLKKDVEEFCTFHRESLLRDKKSLDLAHGCLPVLGGVSTVMIPISPTPFTWSAVSGTTPHRLMRHVPVPESGNTRALSWITALRIFSCSFGGGPDYSGLAGAGESGAGECDLEQAQAGASDAGLTLAVHDSVDLYALGHTWQVRIDPACEFVSETLTPGDYTFGVSALDAAGNESAVTWGVAIHIVDVPAEVTGV